jgi:hypothetical protein
MTQGATKPEKAIIIDLDDPLHRVTCLFNPSEISFSKSAQWQPNPAKHEEDTPEPTFSGGQPARLSMQLFFDTTRDGSDVRLHTDKLVEFTLINPKVLSRAPRPSYCMFLWGGESAATAKTYFIGYIPQVDIKFSLFLSDGTPVRADVSLSFIAIPKKLGPQNPTSRSVGRTVWQVMEGHTLDAIAHQTYGHPGYWRFIAETNNLDDPLALRSGQMLRLLPLPADYRL